MGRGRRSVTCAIFIFPRQGQRLLQPVSEQIEDCMADRSNGLARPLIVFLTRDTAPQITPAPISRTWMSKLSETRKGWPNRCLPMLTANQSGWELRNRCAFTATWLGQENGADVLLTPAQGGTRR